MVSFRLLVTTSAAALLAMVPAFGEAAPARVRGTVTTIDDGSITVKEQDGRTFTLKTGPYTMYSNVIPSSLDAIKVNTFVGSAVKGPLNSMVAVELAMAVSIGSVVMIKTDPGDQAGLVTVGKGVTPPM